MIDKVGAIIVQDKRLLIVREQGKEVFLLPGGRREAGESDERCLKRELEEELGTGIRKMEYYREFIADVPPENDKVKIRAYSCDVNGSVMANGEIAELFWVDRNNYRNVNLSNALRLIVSGLITENIL